MDNADGQTSSTLSILTQDEKEGGQMEGGRVEGVIRKSVPLLVFAVLTGYFAWATQHFIVEDGGLFRHTMCDGYGFLTLIYILIFLGFSIVYIIQPFLVEPVNNAIVKPVVSVWTKAFDNKLLLIGTHVVIIAIMLAYLIWDTWEEKERLIPMAGLIIFLLFGFVCSRHRKHINWYTIVRGLILQFIFGLFTLRWETGRSIFGCAGDKVSTFINYAKNGSEFVYGPILTFQYHIFAFETLSTIYFLSFGINILYHWGIMQKIVVNLGLLLQFVMGTSICESVNSAANIFLGMTESPLLVKPYLEDLTNSELHAIMTGGFASVSGTVLAAYISFGASPAHLITASLMAAPAGLVYSKLMFPQKEKIRATKDKIALIKSNYASVLDAASQGATQATQIVLGITASLIAFIATVHFINGVLSWMGELVGFSDPEDMWTIELIVGYIFTPISFAMGVPWKDCRNVGKLIGLKMMVNEFAAFKEFQIMKESLSARSRIIATFAICGFGNPSSIGIMISAFGAMVPSRGKDITDHVFRAFLSGTIVCFTTACMAGMLSP